jgi:two-component system, chemotaxis family, CheB/CheR fusion protein
MAKSQSDVNASNSSSLFPVVGIGASAGGITVLQSLFQTLPEKLGAAVVVIVHLDPEHASDLRNILAACTAMPVLQVDDRLPLEADKVYVIPPNRRLLVSGSDIATAAFEEPRGQRTPIDHFFRSLAERHGDGFAIILTGAGSDGAVGVKAVKEAGGLILVQDPNEAEYSSMPRSAIASGVADLVLPVRELATQLVELIRSKEQLQVRLNQDDEDILRRIFGHLSVRTGHDFSKYKRATVMRRLTRRMQVMRIERLGDYLSLLRDSATEVQMLFCDLLISVTTFFRDADAFKKLEAQVIPRLFDNKDGTNSVRAWIPGCATGEEAYSIAILLLEEASRREDNFDVQLFASDLDARALVVAREGRYPTAISSDVSEERLRHFFVREGEHYRIRREVRDTVVFASHSLLKDPPFSHVDLISCRNLLIYLDPDLQEQVCATFHYALFPHGYLFLGTAENADCPAGLFRIIDREARIYQVSDRPRTSLPPLPRSVSTRRPELRAVRTATLRAPTTDATHHRQALEQFAPPSMLVDEAHQILNLSETAGRYLLLPGGPVISEASEIVRPELKLELRAALDRAFDQNESSLSLPIPVQFNGSPQLVTLHVRSIMRENMPRAALVLFLEGGSAERTIAKGSLSGDNGSSSVVARLREELVATRTQLRRSQEHHEAATEELRAANEELQSIGEEYRSTAEELETSKEELQSINEELQTVNSELKLKLEAVSRAHNDLQNLISATDVGTLFLDAGLHIKLFTPRVSELFNITPGDEERPITNFTHHLVYDELACDVKRVMANLTPIERMVESTTGRSLLLRLRPYRTLDNRIDGVVATFVDITEQRKADETWQNHQRLLLRELTHRVKNTLAVVQAMARQSLRGSGANRQALDDFTARLNALSVAHEVLLRNDWKGAELHALVSQQLAPYLVPGSERLWLKGPRTLLPAAVATPFSLLLHELATNAAKYGALNTPSGRVNLVWQTVDREAGLVLEVVWSEEGGPPVTRPQTAGFGSYLIEYGLGDACVHRDFRPEGFVCKIELPLRR